MITQQNPMMRRSRLSVAGLLSLTLGGALANACGDPFSTCEAHRNCPPTGGSGGEGAGGIGGASGDAGESDATDGGGSGGDSSGDSGLAGGGAAGETATGGRATGGANSMAGGNPGGTTGTDGGASGADGRTSAEGGTDVGGASAAGSGGAAGSNHEGGSGGAEDPCTPNPCANNGGCVATGSQATCTCAKGYVGKQCELPVFEGIGVIDSKSFAAGVSGDGTKVAGTSGSTAISWNRQTGIQALEVLNGYTTCRGMGISSDGSTPVGTCFGTGTKARPVRWVAGKVEDVDPQGTTSAWASAVNFNGTVVVGYILGTATTATRPFRWTPGSGLVEIPALAPGEDTYALATSNDGGTVVGVSGTLGYRWSIGSNPQGIGSRDSTPLGINANGTAIVGEMPNENGKSHAFRWTQSDGLVDLGVLATDPETHAYDVSDDGNVIVGESGPAELGEAMLWTKAAGLQPLKTVLANAGANLAGWQVGTAWAVSANGKVIVGWGTHDTRTEGWIARLP